MHARLNHACQESQAAQEKRANAAKALEAQKALDRALVESVQAEWRARTYRIEVAREPTRERWGCIG